MKPSTGKTAGLGEAVELSPLLLSDEEKRVLELYDRLQQLQLELALLTSQKKYVLDRRSSEDVQTAQISLLESRARYVLRNEVAESVMIGHPVLQAVHEGKTASPIEMDLLPLISQRDIASSTLAHQSTTLRRTLETLTEVESQSLRLGRENMELASQVLALAEEVNKHKTEPIVDPEQAEEIAGLEQDVKGSRRRWRVMKATASAIVAGSGVDWARDDELRSIVLDEDEDGV